MDPLTTAALLAGVIGLGAGAAELTARYRDDPVRALTSWPGLLYMAFNGLIAVAAAYLLRRFAPDVTGSPDIDIWSTALAAGFGSLAVMRLSIVRLRVGSDEVGVGPALVIEQILRVVDRGVDRRLAERRAELAKEFADRFDFARDAESLVLTCLALLQNASPEEQTRMTDTFRALAGQPAISNRIKAINLTLALLGLVGDDVLRSAINVVREDAAGAGGAGAGAGGRP